MDWHEAYQRRYQKLKEAGKSFFPYAVFKDALVAVLVVAALCAAGHFIGARLEDIADPSDASYNPRPDWYFLFLFQALKFFPGRLESIATVLLPGLGVTALFLLPLVDRGPKRHPLDRPWMTGITIVVVSLIVLLTWEGDHSPLLNPIVKRDPLAAKGARVFREMKCFYCHTINGNGGGQVGPDLANVTRRVDDVWLARHFRNPQAGTPGSAMPKLNLMDDEITALIAYLKTTQTNESYSPEAPKRFAENCAVCHKINGLGAAIGPDLSGVGLRRDPKYIQRYIAHSTATNAQSVMPQFGDLLTTTEIEDLARYLSAQRKNK